MANQNSRVTRITLFSLLLILMLAGFFTGYIRVASDLPSQIYSSTQADYLSRNAYLSLSQFAPSANYMYMDSVYDPSTSSTTSSTPIIAVLPVKNSHVEARLVSQQTEEEGVSVTVYDLEFLGEYELSYPGPEESTQVELFFPFPNNLETLHEVRFLVDGEEPLEVEFSIAGIRWETELLAGEERQITISYKANGANSFAYGLSQDQRSNVDVTIIVDGLTGSSIPQNSLSSTSTEGDANSETFTWDYSGLIADQNIRIDLPTDLTFVQRVAALQTDFSALAWSAPIMVVLFMVSLAGVFYLSKIQLSLESYLLTGCGIALFYPLLTFLSGLMEVTLAAPIALLSVTVLVLGFLGQAVGWRQTWWRAGMLIAIILGLFSLGMLTSLRGLLLSIGGFLLVGIFMALYAQNPVTAKREPRPALSDEQDDDQSPNDHCPRCGESLESDHAFCPTCGFDTDSFDNCPKCDHGQYSPSDLEEAFCINCGESLG